MKPGLVRKARDDVLGEVRTMREKKKQERGGMGVIPSPGIIKQLNGEDRSGDRLIPAQPSTRLTVKKGGRG